MKHGFSLVELSIVLVILGLLTGGILAGQSLIHAAELRSVSTEYDKLRTATQIFRDKYFALPGDMSNATSFWGKAHPTPTTCVNTRSTGPETCDGNGDGMVVNTSTSYEIARYWQHLANAGLIEGQYGGLGDVKADFPRSKLSSDAKWNTLYRSTIAANSSLILFGGNYGHLINLGGFAVTNTLRPEDAWTLDTKMDDGAPSTGSATTSKGSTAFPCTLPLNSLTDAGATYNFAEQGIYCNLYFRM